MRSKNIYKNLLLLRCGDVQPIASRSVHIIAKVWIRMIEFHHLDTRAVPIDHGGENKRMPPVMARPDQIKVS